MLDYDSFKKIVEESIMDYIPDRDNYQVNIHPVMKSNGKIYDGMCLIPNNPEASILPTVYLNTMYDTYQATERLDDIIKNTASILMDSKQKLLDSGVETLECNPLDLICGENVKSKVIFSLVNTDANSEMLSDMPSREFQDLSVIYKLYLSDLSNGGYATININNKIADMVYEVNQDAVREEERLSNQVYKYDAKTREISIASDASIHRDIKDAPENTNNVEYDQQPRRHRGR